MSTETHTYRIALPVPEINSIVANGISQTGTVRSGFACAEVDDQFVADIGTELAARGWTHVDTGDQRPAVTTFTQTYSATETEITAHPSWSAPGITASYPAGVTLFDGATAADLNDLAGRCATLEAEVIALRSTVVQCLKHINALVDLLQAHGIAE